ITFYIHPLPMVGGEGNLGNPSVPGYQHCISVDRPLICPYIMGGQVMFLNISSDKTAKTMIMHEPSLEIGLQPQSQLPS
ncbi:MAG: hypothetical protein LUP95_02840, partial [Euryarchaeota archaeon]|nr:hypothetical protein [Euryarchaeota archaeon]